MITIKQINQHIAEQERKIKEEIPSDKAGLLNRAKKRIDFLRECVLYLEGEPSEEYVNKEASRLQDRVTKIEGGFLEWHKKQLPDHKTTAQWKTYYYNMMGLEKHKRHLETVKYLLQLN